MASTRTAPSWQPPVAGCCQDLPGRSGDEPLLRGGYLAGHGPAGLGDQYPDRGPRGVGRDRGRRAGWQHSWHPRARHPDPCRHVPGRCRLAGADVPGRSGDRAPCHCGGIGRRACLRSIAFALLTPFFFLRAGTLISAPALITGAGVIGALLLVKLAAKMIGVWPVAAAFRLPRKERTYTTLLMATGLTLGSIAALFGLTHGLIDKTQYTEPVTVVILSAFVPTLIAQQLFRPAIVDTEEEEALGEEDLSIIHPGGRIGSHPH